MFCEFLCSYPSSSLAQIQNVVLNVGFRSLQQDHIMFLKHWQLHKVVAAMASLRSLHIVQGGPLVHTEDRISETVRFEHNRLRMKQDAKL